LTAGASRLGQLTLAPDERQVLGLIRSAAENRRRLPPGVWSLAGPTRSRVLGQPLVHALGEQIAETGALAA
jgi:hypothetical protein